MAGFLTKKVNSFIKNRQVRRRKIGMSKEWFNVEEHLVYLEYDESSLISQGCDCKFMCLSGDICSHILACIYYKRLEEELKVETNQIKGQN